LSKKWPVHKGHHVCVYVASKAVGSLSVGHGRGVGLAHTINRRGPLLASPARRSSRRATRSENYTFGG
jgi:hypothetical protein